MEAPCLDRKIVQLSPIAADGIGHREKHGQEAARVERCAALNRGVAADVVRREQWAALG